MSLTVKQASFVNAYVIEPNGKRAAIAAGYSAAGAEVTASKLLRVPKVAKAIAERQKLLAVRAGVTPEMVVAELARLGFADIRQVVRWRTREDQTLFTDAGNPVDVPHIEVTIADSDELDQSAAAAIAEISQSKDGALKVKMHDKLGALVKIGQHLGMFRVAQSTADEPLGKKEQAEEFSRGAHKGTGWDGLLQ